MSDTHSHDDGHGHDSDAKKPGQIIPETSIQDTVLKALALSTMVVFGFLGWSWIQFPFMAPTPHNTHHAQRARTGEASTQPEHGQAGASEHSATPETNPTPTGTQPAPAVAPAGQSRGGEAVNPAPATAAPEPATTH